MVTFLTVLSGAAWTVVYLEAIRVGLRDRTYAVPAAALALNLAWEAVYAVHALASGGGVQGWIILVWLAADTVVLGTYLRFGRAELPAFVTPALFAGWNAALFATAFVVQGLFVAEFGWGQAARYTAFLQNLLMSVLFLALLAARGSGRGQSLTIAWAKWIGTLAPTVVFGHYEGSAFVLGLGVLCSVFDLAYIVLLTRVRRSGPARTRRGTPGPPRPVAG